jgi:hypothetical protein
LAGHEQDCRDDDNEEAGGTYHLGWNAKASLKFDKVQPHQLAWGLAYGLGEVAGVAAGTGNPFFSTDTTAALRANEIGAEVLLKSIAVAFPVFRSTIGSFAESGTKFIIF